MHRLNSRPQYLFFSRFCSREPICRKLVCISSNSVDLFYLHDAWHLVMNGGMNGPSNAAFVLPISGVGQRTTEHVPHSASAASAVNTANWLYSTCRAIRQSMDAARQQAALKRRRIASKQQQQHQQHRRHSSPRSCADASVSRRAAYT